MSKRMWKPRFRGQKLKQSKSCLRDKRFTKSLLPERCSLRKKKSIGSHLQEMKSRSQNQKSTGYHLLGMMQSQLKTWNWTSLFKKGKMMTLMRCCRKRKTEWIPNRDSLSLPVETDKTLTLAELLSTEKDLSVEALLDQFQGKEQMIPSSHNNYMLHHFKFQSAISRKLSLLMSSMKRQQALASIMSSKLTTRFNFRN